MSDTEGEIRANWGSVGLISLIVRVAKRLSMGGQTQPAKLIIITFAWREFDAKFRTFVRDVDDVKRKKNIYGSVV